MRLDIYLKVVFTVIALCLTFLTADRLLTPYRTQAQTPERDLFIEPGYTTIRKLDGSGHTLGKVVIDRKTGDIWGFPTGTEAPYPVLITKNEPPVSRPVYLGRFDFSRLEQ